MSDDSSRVVRVVIGGGTQGVAPQEAEVAVAPGEGDERGRGLGGSIDLSGNMRQGGGGGTMQQGKIHIYFSRVIFLRKMS